MNLEKFAVNAESLMVLKLPGFKKLNFCYYYIKANGIDEAIVIAKDNPEFEFVPSASIEVRPIKMKEELTNFVYQNCLNTNCQCDHNIS